MKDGDPFRVIRVKKQQQQRAKTENNYKLSILKGPGF